MLSPDRLPLGSNLQHMVSRAVKSSRVTGPIYPDRLDAGLETSPKHIASIQVVKVYHKEIYPKRFT